MPIAGRVLFELKKYFRKLSQKTSKNQKKKKKTERSSFATGTIKYTSQQSKSFF